jgi:fermentation-respiration switch protein FrsA (DUF1100 family)
VTILKTLGFLVALGAAWAAFLFLVQRPMLFPAPRAAMGDRAALDRAGGELVPLSLPIGIVESWLLPPEPLHTPAPLLIYAHGNGELIDFWAESFGELRAAGLAVLLVEYPGYGRSAGAPSQASIVATFLAAYDRLASDPRIDANNIAVYGRSLGGGAVAQLAKQRPVRAMILESSFTSVADLARHYGIPRWLVRDPFDSLAVVREFRQPLLLLHGSRDEIIPVDHSRALAAANSAAELQEYACGHNDCAPQWELVRTFLAQAGVLSNDVRRAP